jgi:hypothetical protein
VGFSGRPNFRSRTTRTGVAQERRALVRLSCISRSTEQIVNSATGLLNFFGLLHTSTHPLRVILFLFVLVFFLLGHGPLTWLFSSPRLFSSFVDSECPPFPQPEAARAGFSPSYTEPPSYLLSQTQTISQHGDSYLEEECPVAESCRCSCCSSGS